MVDTADPEEKWCIAVIWMNGSNTSRAGDAIRRILCEVISGVLHRAIELWLEAWLGGQLSCGDWAQQLCTARAEVAQDFDLLHLELEVC